MKCVDIPNFKDKYGTTCARTKEFGNCNGGNPWKQNIAQLQSDANADGVSVLDACCVCGGGTDQSSMYLYNLFFFYFLVSNHTSKFNIIVAYFILMS